MATYAQIDTSQFPLVVITFMEKTSSDEDFERYLSEMKDLYEARKNLAIIFDARNAPLPSLKQQQKQAAWLRRNNDLLNEFCAGTAYVITKRTVRMILRVIFSITPQAAPYKVCSNMNDAEEWARAQLSA